MIGSIAAWLLANNLVGSLTAARRGARAMLAIAGLALAAIALGFGVWLIRRDAVEEFRAEERVRHVEQALAGERRATRAEADRTLARDAAFEEIDSRLETIHAEDSEAAAAPASRGSRAVADRLRNR